MIQALAMAMAARTAAGAANELDSAGPARGTGRRGGSTWARLLPVVVVLPALLIVGLVAGSPSADPSCAAQPTAIFDGDLARVLATIRTVETGGDYATTITTSSASGAYAFIDAAWAGYGGYSRAWLAPPAVQDAKAAEYASAILQRHHGDVSTVPVTWYLGHLPSAGSAEWDSVPAPGAGNRLTPGEYQTKWMAVYDHQLAAMPAASSAAGPSAEEGPTCVGVIGSPSAAPAGVDQLVASQISWGGYANGQIPLDAMRYSPRSGYLHPSASAAWDQLSSAALADGFDLAGSGYRPDSAGGATAGRSNHRWGLAIDVSALVPGNRYRIVDAAFASGEYQWLQANTATYGWINPSWARPTALGGTGTGGHVGTQCCFLEPWHWEWAAFLGASAPATAGEAPS